MLTIRSQGTIFSITPQLPLNDRYPRHNVTHLDGVLHPKSVVPESSVHVQGASPDGHPLL